MSLLSDFSIYRDKYGMNQLGTNGTEGGVTQNGALFTMEYIVCMLEDPNTSKDDKVRELARLVDVYRSLEVIPGLSRRTPESTEGDSMDNNGSNLTFSAMFDHKSFAKRMKAHGENVECTQPLNEDHRRYYLLARFVTLLWIVCRPWLIPSWIKSGFKPKFYWNNSEPEKFATWGWYGRSPGFLGLADLCAQGYTTPFRWLGVLVGQFIGPFKDKGDTDARKLPYVIWYFLTKYTGWGQRWFWKLGYKIWTHFLMKQYPEGMRDVYRMYYQDPNHPIKKWSQPYFK